MLIEDDRCYLADFGLTKLTDATAATPTGDVLGTLSYAAPEQIEGGAIDRRADVYALGATAYECLVGATPFAHRAGAALLYAQLTEPPPRASDRRPELPTAVDAVLARALAKRPDDRYAPCGEFAAALADAVAAPSGAPAAPPAPARESHSRGRCSAAARTRSSAATPSSRRLARRARRRPRRATGDRLPRRRARDRQDPAGGGAGGRAPTTPARRCCTGAPTRTRSSRTSRSSRRCAHLCAHVDVAGLPARGGRAGAAGAGTRRPRAPAPTGDPGADRYRMFEARRARPGPRRARSSWCSRTCSGPTRRRCCSCATCSRPRCRPRWR